MQFVKMKFMGRDLLALNIMWKYREQVRSCHGHILLARNAVFLRLQKSFYMSEERYIEHLEGIARCVFNPQNVHVATQ